MDTSDIIQIVVGSVTALIAIVAVVMTCIEIRTQNKQCLFDKRLANYIVCRKFYNLVLANIDLLDFDKTPNKQPIDVVFPFYELANCGFLENGAKIIDNVSNFELKKQFLKNMESIETMSEKSKLLFKDKIGGVASEFFLCFREVLLKMYRYKILSDSILNSDSCKLMHKTFPELSKEFKEEKYRDELIESVRRLKKIIKKIEKNNTLDLMYKKTRLIK